MTLVNESEEKHLNKKHMEALEEEKLERVDSLLDTDLASTSSGVSSILITEDSRSNSCSGDISVSSTSSGEIQTILLSESAVTMLVEPASPSSEELTVMATTSGASARLDKCVGRKNKGVTWGFRSVIGRRREMEDAVAIVPGFMSRTCDHVGGCTAPGSSTSGEISPLHFFGVYDGHGGSQVLYVIFFHIYF